MTAKQAYVYDMDELRTAKALGLTTKEIAHSLDVAVESIYAAAAREDGEEMFNILKLNPKRFRRPIRWLETKQLEEAARRAEAQWASPCTAESPKD